VIGLLSIGAVERILAEAGVDMTGLIEATVSRRTRAPRR
jgi:hypothetical protein